MWIEGREEIERKKLLNYHRSELGLLRRIEVFEDEYNKWRRNPEIKKSVGRECVICGSGKNLEGHHLFQSINSKRKNDDAIIVCKNCHLKIHSKKGYEDFIRAKFLSRNEN